MRNNTQYGVTVNHLYSNKNNNFCRRIKVLICLLTCCNKNKNLIELNLEINTKNKTIDRNEQPLYRKYFIYNIKTIETLVVFSRIFYSQNLLSYINPMKPKQSHQD